LKTCNIASALISVELSRILSPSTKQIKTDVGDLSAADPIEGVMTGLRAFGSTNQFNVRLGAVTANARSSKGTVVGYRRRAAFATYRSRSRQSPQSL
jgi:hypothetical protein